MFQIEIEEYMEKIKKKYQVKMPDNPMLYGYKVYSQCDEDGIINYILDKINYATPTTKTFIEFGCGNGLENNTHYLSLNGYYGCWIDGNDKNIAFIKDQLGECATNKLKLLKEFVTVEKIEMIINECIDFLGTENIDFLSMDLDFNDWYFMKTILKLIRPKCICVEYNAKFPASIPLVPNYNPNHIWSGGDYFGSTLMAYSKLLTDYILVCCNISGVNAFFVRSDLSYLFPKYNYDDLYQPPRYELTGYKPGHKSTMQWLKKYLNDTQTAQHDCIIVNTYNKRSFPFFIHKTGDPYISGRILKYHTYENFESQLLINLIDRDDFFLDIGANIGWHTANASLSIGNEGQIISIEPEKNNFFILQKNVENLKQITGHNITCQNFAFSDYDGKGSLNIAPINCGDHRIFPTEEQRDTEEINIQTLDTFLKNHNSLPTVIKMDTQGAEGSIIKGAQNLFNNNWRPVWLFEFWPNGLRRGNSDPLEFLDYFLSLGYFLYELDEKSLNLLKVQRDNLSFHIQNLLEDNLTDKSIDLLAICPNNSKFNKLKLS